MNAFSECYIKAKKIYTRIPVHFIMNYKCITWLDTSGLKRSDPNHGPEKDNVHQFLQLMHTILPTTTVHLSKKGARYRSLKHTTAIICPPGASVRPKHRSETSDSCMHIQEPIIREKTLGHQRRKQLIIYFYIC